MASMLQRLSQGLRTGFALALLMVAGYAMAQGVRCDHPDTSIVVRGDTLWHIAGKFVQHPWLWPESWPANPPISNPQLISPGDVTSLAHHDHVTVQPGPRDHGHPRQPTT